MDEPATRKIGGAVQPFRDLRTAERAQFLIEQPVSDKRVIRPCSKPDGDIRIAPSQIDQMRRGVDQHIHVGLAKAESLEPRHKPGGGKGRLGRNDKPPAPPSARMRRTAPAR